MSCYVKLRNQLFVQLGLCLAALVTAIMKQMQISVCCLLGMALLRFVLHRKWTRDFSQAITDGALACNIGPKLEQFAITRKGGGGITPKDVLDAELFPVREGSEKSVGFYQGIDGTVRGMAVSLNDTSLQMPHSGYKKLEVAIGVWIRFVLPKDTGRNFRILSKDYLTDGLRKEYFSSLPGMTERGAAEAGFKDKLYLYEEAPSSGGAEDPEAAAVFAPFSNTFIAAVNGLLRKTNGKPAISVKGNTVNIFIRDHILAPNYPANKKPDEKFLTLDPIPEFRDAMRLAESLQ